MSLRFLILNADYPEFLSSLYAGNPGLERRPFGEQMRARLETLCGMADFYSSNLRRLGHEAHDIYANNECAQKAWAREQGIGVAEGGPAPSHRDALQPFRRMAARTPLRHLRPLFPVFRQVLGSLHGPPPWFYEILAAQIKHYRPDVLLNQEMGSIGPRFLREIKPHVGLLLGQHAATRPPGGGDYGVYDLVISSFPPTVELFRQQGVPAHLSRLAFEPRVLASLGADAQGAVERSHDLSFIGSFYLVHSSRTALLETLCARFPQMKVWGPELDGVARHSALRRCYAGGAWGAEMYRILRSSKITLNHHGDVLPYANNMRLYEATGAGALLVTDWKENLGEMFEPGREIVAYRTPEECAELIDYYLQHDGEREAIARAGQERTLKEHTYYHRAEELVELIRRHLRTRTVGAASRR